MQSQAHHHLTRTAATKARWAVARAHGQITCSHTHAGPQHGATLRAGAGKRSFVHEQRHCHCQEALGQTPDSPLASAKLSPLWLRQGPPVLSPACGHQSGHSEPRVGIRGWREEPWPQAQRPSLTPSETAATRPQLCRALGPPTSLFYSQSTLDTPSLPTQVLGPHHEWKGPTRASPLGLRARLRIAGAVVSWPRLALAQAVRVDLMVNGAEHQAGLVTCAGSEPRRAAVSQPSGNARSLGQALLWTRPTGCPDYASDDPLR